MNNRAGFVCLGRCPTGRPLRQWGMTEHSTVRSVTYDLLRSLGLTTVFGNPGSTEQTFLQEFPGDFRYVLALQEASGTGASPGPSSA
jgi:Thiamine pyrophosphate enzyme, N-terminal TPP binding domain